jgi:hypothetical protein
VIFFFTFRHFFCRHLAAEGGFIVALLLASMAQHVFTQVYFNAQAKATEPPRRKRPESRITSETFRFGFVPSREFAHARKGYSI